MSNNYEEGVVHGIRSGVSAAKPKRVKSAASKKTDKEWILQRRAVNAICRCIGRYHGRGFNVTVAIETNKNQMFLCNSLNENICESFSRILNRLGVHETEKYDCGIHKMLIDGTKIIDSTTEERKENKKLQKDEERQKKVQLRMEQQRHKNVRIAHKKARNLRKKAHLKAISTQQNGLAECDEKQKRLYENNVILNPCSYETSSCFAGPSTTPLCIVEDSAEQLEADDMVADGFPENFQNYTEL